MAKVDIGTKSKSMRKILTKMKSPPKSSNSTAMMRQLSLARRTMMTKNLISTVSLRMKTKTKTPRSSRTRTKPRFPPAQMTMMTMRKRLKSNHVCGPRL